ncbi:ADP-ribosylglycohydrolase [Opitutaceae bacterium TAV1]|nr:ADP-ribosylglycohydrolase [Opitutaceae bacterium TAV1]
MITTPDHAKRLAGVLLGTAAGDALGLPAEGLAPLKIAARWKGRWKHRFIAGRGMISDDTEHASMVAQSLLGNPNDAAAFQSILAWKFRWWLAGLPAGVGLATARAIFKLWIGFPPDRSGVVSAGNGPAMRSAVIGVFFAEDSILRRQFVEASTRLTHTDPRALIGALAVAEIAAWACSTQNTPPLAVLGNLSDHPEWRHLVNEMEAACRENLDVQAFAARLGLAKGVSGYVFHTVPVALYAWWRHRGDFRGALEAALDCGGDTDTVGAITGALMGADLGEDAIPDDLIVGIADWPRTPKWLRRLADRLARQSATSEALGSVPLFWPALPLRNLGFLIAVLVHGFARLLPRF